MQHTSRKIAETLGTKACNIRAQPLQYMQHPDLLLQHAFSACNVTLLLGRITELDAGAEVGGGAWSSPVHP